MRLVQKFLEKIPQYTRNSRHLRSVIEHGNIKKIVNLFMAETERKLRRIKVSSRPYILFLDPCNYCNLRCPLCPTGVNNLGREQSMLSFENFKKYIDPHIPYLLELNLHNWGESLMNEDVYKMISYARDNNIATNMSSNFVLIKDHEIDELLDSGLEYLIISLDGTSQEVYEQYRVRGNYERVVKNLKLLLKKRNDRGLKHPFVEWQFIVMKHNEHQVDEAEQLSKEIGVDLMRFIPVGLPYEAKDRKTLAQKWFPASVEGRKNATEDYEQTFGQADKPGPCFYLYRSMVINPDGGVSPCCVVYRANRDFDKLGSSKDPINIPEIWNNDKYMSARSLFSSKIIADRQRTVCDSCDIFSWHPEKGKPKRKQINENKIQFINNDN